MESLSTSTRLVLKILEDLDSPISLSLALRLKAGDMDGILSYSIDPRSYLTALDYFRDAQAVALFSKRRVLPRTSGDRRQLAIEKWWSGERSCYRSNERLTKFHFPSMLEGEDLAIYSIVEKIRKKILGWIGPTPPTLDSIEGRFGPGSTYSDRGKLATVPDKMSSTPTLTAGAFWYVLPYLQTKWGRTNQAAGRGLDHVRGNYFLTVPKNAKIDRAIAIEPAINIFYQLGLGLSLRRRLQKATSWDLDRASDIHREVVKTSSVDCSMATIDLSNASDTVCYELVRLVMPPLWFEELNALRSPFTQVNGKWVKLEKFSSMGNGYTFELETLIFSAICSVVLNEEGALGILGNDLFVFGDDIIIPNHLASTVIAVLRYFGFETNVSKTFTGTLPFRESCGADFYKGSNVRPFYLKEDIDEPAGLFPCINGIRRLYTTLRDLGGFSGFRGWYHLCDSLPADLKRCRGPERLGDSVIHDDAINWRPKWKHGIRYFRGLIVEPRYIPWSHWRSDVVLASALYGSGDGRRGILPRNPILSYKVAWVPSS